MLAIWRKETNAKTAEFVHNRYIEQNSLDRRIRYNRYYHEPAGCLARQGRIVPRDRLWACLSEKLIKKA